MSRGRWSRELALSGPADTYREDGTRLQVRRLGGRDMYPAGRWYVFRQVDGRADKSVAGPFPRMRDARGWVDRFTAEFEQLSLSADGGF